MSNLFWYSINSQLKERAEKLENWKMKEMLREEKKKEKNELLRRQSSLWIDEPELEKKMLEAIVDSKQLWASHLPFGWFLQSPNVCIHFSFHHRLISKLYTLSSYICILPNAVQILEYFNNPLKGFWSCCHDYHGNVVLFFFFFFFFKNPNDLKLMCFSPCMCHVAWLL